MFIIDGRQSPFFQPISRRSCLKSCLYGLGGLTLGGLLRAEAAAGLKTSRKAVINIHLDGGPPHQDMIDLKPDAPAEIRGEFGRIQTKIPAYSICELLPQLAARADKIAFIRSLVGSASAHDAFQVQSGYDEKDLKPIGGRPAMGSVVSLLQGSTADESPAFVDLMQGRPLVRNSARPGFLGQAYKPFRPDLSAMFARKLEPGMVKELEARGMDHAIQLTLPDGLSADRVFRRDQLRSTMASLQHGINQASPGDSMDAFNQQALQMLTSGRFAKAMDLSQEDPAVLARYTMKNSDKHAPVGTSDGAEATKKFLLSRRLVEAGVRAVSLSLSDFDTHSDNFPRMRRVLPILDHGLSMLLDDLHQRELIDDVSIVVWGEFGRTPKIASKTGGRDHWPRVGMALLAGGGMKVGQVIGSTDKDAGAAASRPVHVQEVFATLYHNLGIDPETTILDDPTGRPQPLFSNVKPLSELI
jgi:hypothetical protein